MLPSDSDPWSTSSMVSINYAPTLDVDVDIDAPNESGGAEAFAADSKTFTDDGGDLTMFDADEDPMGQMLWYLSLGSDEITSAKSDVGVDFVLNPEDLTDGELTFDPGFVTEAEADYSAMSPDEATDIDDEIDKDISSELTISGDDVNFNGDIMPANTMLNLSGDEEFADEVDATIGVPLPASRHQRNSPADWSGAVQLRRARIA